MTVAEHEGRGMSALGFGPRRQEAQRIDGVQIAVCPDQARYVLPEEVLPGVPWPPGFKDSIDTWARGFFSPQNLIQDGQAISVAGVIHMNPRTYAAFKANIKDQIIQAISPR